MTAPRWAPDPLRWARLVERTPGTTPADALWSRLLASGVSGTERRGPNLWSWPDPSTLTAHGLTERTAERVRGRLTGRGLLVVHNRGGRGNGTGAGAGRAASWHLVGAGFHPCAGCTERARKVSTFALDRGGSGGGSGNPGGGSGVARRVVPGTTPDLPGGGSGAARRVVSGAPPYKDDTHAGALSPTLRDSTPDGHPEHRERHRPTACAATVAAVLSFRATSPTAAAAAGQPTGHDARHVDSHDLAGFVRDARRVDGAARSTRPAPLPGSCSDCGHGPGQHRPDPLGRPACAAVSGDAGNPCPCSTEPGHPS